MQILRSSPEVVDEILGLPNLWPGEDRAIVEAHRNNGGDLIKSYDFRLMANTSLRGRGSVLTRLIHGQKQYRQQRADWWSTKRPEGSISYHDWVGEQSGQEVLAGQE